MTRRRCPVPADFAAAARRRDPRAAGARPSAATGPAASPRLRARMAAEGVDAYFGAKREHMRWLTGFTLAEGEEKVAGHSGQFLVGPDDVVTSSTDSRYTIQARREAPDAVVDEIGYDLPGRLAAAARRRLGARRVAVEAAAVSARAVAAPRGRRARTWSWSRSRAGSRRMRAVKTPDEVERIAAACAVADRALAALLPEIRAGRHRARPRAAPRVADPDRRRGGARVRRRLPRRTRGGAAARLARRPAGAGRRGAAVRLRRPGRGLPQRHDPDAVRRRAGRARPRGLRPRRGGRSRRRSTRSRRRSPRAARRPSRREPDAIARARHRRRRDAGRPTATAWATGSASPPTRSRACRPHRDRRRRCPSPHGVLGRARDLPRGRDRRPDRGPRPPRRRPRARRAPDAVPARRHRRCPADAPAPRPAVRTASGSIGRHPIDLARGVRTPPDSRHAPPEHQPT